MPRRFQLPMYALAAGLLGLIVLLAALQYRWVAQISNAERERMKSTLSARSSAFAQDFDRELTRAYLLFQMEPVASGDTLPARLAVRYDRWHATARFPRLIRDIYVVTRDLPNGEPRLQRFDPATRFVEPIEWPPSLHELRAQMNDKREPAPEGGQRIVRTIAGPLWEQIPALLVPAPVLVFNGPSTGAGRGTSSSAPVHLAPHMSYTVVMLDREFLSTELLPALARQHFRDKAEDFDYELAVVSAARQDVVYHSSAAFIPKPDAAADIRADLFQVRTQDFAQMVSEVRRFTALSTSESFRGAAASRDRGVAGGSGGAEGGTATFTTILPGPPGADGRQRMGERVTIPLPDGRGAFPMNEPLSIVVQQTGPAAARTFFNAAVTGALTKSGPSEPKWRLMVQHPAGSLERAVNAARTRNLLVSSSILAVLGVSLGLLVLSTRRAQELARQQMEFVAAVSHELRTPLAVIRSAGENLADGVVHDDGQIRKYGELVRSEGRRLSEMVEQILEFSGIQSGQRGFALRPVPLAPLLQDVVGASSALIDDARIEVEFEVPADLPPVLGEEAALRRVFQNLVGNAIKYGVTGGWIGIRAGKDGNQVRVTIADRGPGIEPAEQPKIFDPFYRASAAVAAQIQGAGLGLSLVKRIVEAHQGRVTVKSAPGAGAEFIVYLPAATGEAVHQAAEAGLPEAAAGEQNLPRYS
jgi:signal transduction histidine kinase